VENLRVHPGDVRDLFDVLPDASVAKAFLLYPDPWPKTRHHRRRFVTPEHLEPLARVLKPGAEFRVATDIPDYVRQTLQEVPRHGFAWEAEGPSDWREPWDDWLSTRYEQKGAARGARAALPDLPTQLVRRSGVDAIPVRVYHAHRPETGDRQEGGGPCPATAIRYR
jgi:tRNA G46 methylase TrmB